MLIISGSFQNWRSSRNLVDWERTCYLLFPVAYIKANYLSMLFRILPALSQISLSNFIVFPFPGHRKAVPFHITICYCKTFFFFFSLSSFLWWVFLSYCFLPSTLLLIFWKFNLSVISSMRLFLPLSSLVLTFKNNYYSPKNIIACWRALREALGFRRWLNHSE